jgi:transcriptional regulator with XRE-family HTH domain
LKEMKDRLPARRRRKVEARAQELIAEQMTLRDLRKARSQTQKSMAKKLKVGQDSISRLEQRSDLLLSTLQAYISAMGGSLELVVRFPDRPDVTLAGLLDLKPEKASAPHKATARRDRQSTPRDAV